MFFFENHAENDVGALFPDPFLTFNEALCEVKASALAFSFTIFQ